MFLLLFKNSTSSYGLSVTGITVSADHSNLISDPSKQIIIRKTEISFGVYLTVMIIKTLSFKLQFPIRRSMGTKSHIPIRHLNIGICSILKNGMDI